MASTKPLWKQNLWLKKSKALIPFHIALIHPEIPGNTGNIGRLAVGIGAQLHLVKPLGFELSEKAVRRAGIDHWNQVNLRVHESREEFLEWAGDRRLHLFSARGEQPYSRLKVAEGDVLVFGAESVGLPVEMVEAHGAWRIPTPGQVRSLNLSNSVAIVAYHALQTTCSDLF